MSSRESFESLKKYLTNLCQVLFPESYSSLPKDVLVNCIRGLIHSLNEGLNYYHTLTDFNEKMEVKPTLIFSQELLAQMSRLLRFEQEHLTNCNQILKDLERMLVNQTILINTKYKNIAEKELKLINSYQLKKMLEKTFHSFL